MTELIIPSRPALIHEAVRLANDARLRLEAAIDATEPETDLCLQFQEAHDDLCSAIGYMTAVPETGYLGQNVHKAQS